MKAPTKAAIKSCVCPVCKELYWLGEGRVMGCRNWDHGKLLPIANCYRSVAKWLVFARQPVASATADDKRPIPFILNGDRSQTFMLYRPARDDANSNTRVTDARREVRHREWRPCKLVPAMEED